MDTVTRVQILDETDCILHSTNILWNGMNPIILSPARNNQLDRLDILALVRQPI